MARLINCECGYVVRGEDDDELVANAQEHMMSDHPEMVGTVTRDDLLAMAEEAKLEAFMGKVLEDLSGTMTTFFCSIGDRLGLFRDLAEHGPATSAELAER